MLQSHSFANTLVLRAPPEQRESDVASAEGASGDNLEHFTQILYKSAFCTIELGKKCSKNGVFSQCSKVAHLRIRWFCARLQNKEKRCSRAPKARAEKIGAFYASFTQKCLSHHCAWHKVHKTLSILRMLQSHSFTNTLVLRAPPERKAMLASAEGASGENLKHYTQILCKSAFCTIGLGKSAQKTECFQNAPKSLIYEYDGFARASRTKRNDARERRRRERRKFGASYASFTQKRLLHHCAWHKLLQNTQYFENTPKSLIYEYEGFARASRAKRNDARERRRREHRKIGAFYTSLTQMCLSHHCAW